MNEFAFPPVFLLQDDSKKIQRRKPKISSSFCCRLLRIFFVLPHPTLFPFFVSVFAPFFLLGFLPFAVSVLMAKEKKELLRKRRRKGRGRQRYSENSHSWSYVLYRKGREVRSGKAAHAPCLRCSLKTTFFSSFPKSDVNLCMSLKEVKYVQYILSRKLG